MKFEQNVTRRAFMTCAALLFALPVFAQDTPKASRPTHPLAIIETVKGKIVIELYPEDAPITVNNFVTLAKKGFYNGLTFHRVEPGFVIQGGDPAGNGSGGPGYDIKNENNKVLKHDRGAVAMANAGRDTAGSQFYVVIDKPAPFLDRKYPDGVNQYTLFGKVIAGQEVAEKIEVGDKMTKVTIKEASLTTPKIAGDDKTSFEVEFVVTVKADGTHTEVVSKSSGDPELDALYLNLLKKTKFEPAKSDGKPTDSQVRVRYTINRVQSGD